MLRAYLAAGLLLLLLVHESARGAEAARFMYCSVPDRSPPYVQKMYYSDVFEFDGSVAAEERVKLKFAAYVSSAFNSAPQVAACLRFPDLRSASSRAALDRSLWRSQKVAIVETRWHGR